ncbi:MAG: EpsG family protein [Eubacterium sp.]
MIFGFTAVQTFLIILFVFAVLYWIIPQKYQWITFLLTALALAYMAHYLVPDELDDLSNYFYFIREMKEGGRERFQEMIDTGQFEWDTYRVAAYYFYFISFLSTPHYLASITIFIVYGLMFLVIYRASIKFNVDKLDTFIGTMFFLATYWYYDTASGIRNGLTFAVVFACAYYHLVERKHILFCYLGYFLAVFTHSSGIIPVMLVLLTIITLNTSGKAFNFILVFATAVASVGINYLAKITDNSLINSLAEKTVHYTEKGSYDSTTMLIVNVVTLILVFLLLLYFTEYLLSGRNSNQLNFFYKYASNTMFFLVGAYFLNLVFLRFVRWIIPMIGALIFMIGMKSQKEQMNSEGLVYTKYYAPPIARLKYKIRPLVYIVFIVYIIIHIWYDCNGSSLVWAHFEDEWIDLGYEYYW